VNGGRDEDFLQEGIPMTMIILDAAVPEVRTQKGISKM